jgi:hypothetical protein
MLVIFLFKKQQLKNKHAYLWIWISIAICAAGIVIPAHFVYVISLHFGIHSTVVLFTLISLVALLLISLSDSITLSKQEEKITRLTQEVSLIKEITERNK